VPKLTVKTQIILAAIGVLAALWAWRDWQGPTVEATRIRQQTLVQTVVASGEVRSQSLARIGSELTGTLKARHVREGDRVKPGDLLLELVDTEQQARVREAEAALQQLAGSSRRQAQAALAEAEANLAQAERERERRETLRERNLIPDEQVEQARRSELSARMVRDRAALQAKALAAGGTEEQVLQQRLAAARAQLARTRVVSPVSGTVQTRNVEPGDLVQPGRTLLEISTADAREIVVQVDEKNMARLAVGQPARIIADAYPDDVLPARITFIAPAVDASRGTIDVHLNIDNSGSRLKQGMTVSATMETGRRDKALVIRNDALREISGNNAVVMRMHDGIATKTALSLGLRGMTMTEVVDGLQPGDVVVIDDVTDGQRLRAQVSSPAATPD
jgi:HlyD family secretion protein